MRINYEGVFSNIFKIYYNKDIPKKEMRKSFIYSINKPSSSFRR